jgi:hypothetical protein
MRQMISGMVAAIALVAASAAPAMACGCSPCGQAYVSPCGQGYVAGPAYYERLPDPVQQYEVAPAAQHQYYYVDQGPTYTGPGNFAPYPTYREGGVTSLHAWRHHHHYGYTGRYTHHSLRYGYATPRHYGYRAHTLRRYY